MAQTSANAASSNAEDTGAAQDWTNPDNLHTDDTNVVGAAFQTSQAGAIWFGFDFTTGDIADGSDIDGFEVSIRGLDSFGDGGWALTIELSDDGGSTYGTSQRVPASGDFSPSGTSAVTQTVGGDGNLLGLTDPVDDADVRSDNLRIRLRSTDTDVFVTDIELEFMSISVFFTAPAAGGFPRSNFRIARGDMVQKRMRRRECGLWAPETPTLWVPGFKIGKE